MAGGHLLSRKFARGNAEQRLNAATAEEGESAPQPTQSLFMLAEEH